MTVNRLLVVFALAQLLAVTSPLEAQWVTYTLVDLGDLPGGDNSSGATGISPNGRYVVGVSSGLPATSCVSESRGFIWERETGMIDLGDVPPPAGHMHCGVFPEAVNDAGIVVGYLGWTIAWNTQGFVWTPARGYSFPSGVRGFAGVNNDGIAVGHSPFYGISWTQAGGVVTLPWSGAWGMSAADINNTGVIVGSQRWAFSYACRWQGGQVHQIDGFCDTANTWAEAVTANGTVVGTSQSCIPPDQRGFIWTASDGLQDIGSLPDFNGVWVFDVNDANTIVGNANGAPNGGFIWTPSDGMRRINELLDQSGEGWDVISPRAIDNAGQIVGSALSPEGVGHAVLLIPSTYSQPPGMNDPPQPPICNGQPGNFCPDGFGLDTTKDYLVVVTHGWQSDGKPGHVESTPERMGELADHIRERIHARGNEELQPSRWQVLNLDWEEPATTGYFIVEELELPIPFWPFGITLHDVANSVAPLVARNRAEQIGEELGGTLATMNHRYVHLIAHSAGGGLIDRASEVLRAARGDDVQIMCTFLDEFSAGRTVGNAADWADAYYSRDRLTNVFTQGAQPITHDVDVTFLDQDMNCGGIVDQLFPSSHSWPVEFYENTVVGSQEGAQGSGFPWSLEGGRFELVDGNPRWTEVTLPRPGSMTVGVSPCPLPQVVYSTTAVSTPVAIGDQLTVPSPTCPPAMNGQSLTLANCVFSPLAGTSSLPETSWVNFAIDLTVEAQFLQADVQFAGEQNAQGLLSIYLDGQYLVSADERFIDGVVTLTAGIPNGMAGGTRSLGLRLDAFTPQPSSVTISNVRQSTIVIESLCPADFVTNATFQPPGDGQVDGADLAYLLGDWGINPGSLADIVTNATFQPPPDGVVDGADLAVLLGAWGPCE